VELTPFFVEGLVRAETLPGMFDLDPVHHALIDHVTGRAFRVGDPVEVQVADVSIERRRIDLALLSALPKEDPGLQGPARPRGRKRLLDGGARGGKPGAGRPAGAGSGGKATGRQGGRGSSPSGSSGGKPGAGKKGGTPGRGGRSGGAGGGRSGRGGGRGGGRGRR
jgi:hypothetical protein